jgi:hypothetical protein
LIQNYASKSIKREPISIDGVEFINQNRHKWAELLIKNYDYVIEKTKTFQEQNPDQEDILYFYDWNNFLTFICQIRNPSKKKIFPHKNHKIWNMNIFYRLADTGVKQGFHGQCNTHVSFLQGIEGQVFPSSLL